MVSAMTKPKFDRDQLISSSEASRKFGDLTKRAQERPQYITKDGNVDTVLIGYDLLEHMYERLMELEEEHRNQVLLSRIDRIGRNPASAKSWRDVRQEG